MTNAAATGPIKLITKPKTIWTRELYIPILNNILLNPAAKIVCIKNTGKEQSDNILSIDLLNFSSNNIAARVIPEQASSPIKNENDAFQDLTRTLNTEKGIKQISNIHTLINIFCFFIKSVRLKKHKRIPKTNHILFSKKYWIKGISKWNKNVVIFKNKANRKIRIISFFVETVKAKKNNAINAYKYQYGDIGCTNKASQKFPTSIFTEDEKIVLRTYDNIENEK